MRSAFADASWSCARHAGSTALLYYCGADEPSLRAACLALPATEWRLLLESTQEGEGASSVARCAHEADLTGRGAQAGEED